MDVVCWNRRLRFLVLFICWVTYLGGACFSVAVLRSERTFQPQDASPLTRSLAEQVPEDVNDDAFWPEATCSEKPVLAITLALSKPLDALAARQMVLELAANLTQDLGTLSTSFDVALSPVINGVKNMRGPLLEWHWERQISHRPDPSDVASIVAILLPSNTGVVDLQSNPEDAALVVTGDTEALKRFIPEQAQRWFGGDQAIARAAFCQRMAAQTLVRLHALVRAEWGATQEFTRDLAAVEQAFLRQTAADSNPLPHALSVWSAVQRLQVHPDLRPTPVFPAAHAAAVLLPLGLPIGVTLLRQTKTNFLKL